MSDIVNALFAGQTPVFNSTAQIYQIVFQFLIFVVNFFTMLGVFWISIAAGVFDRMHERREQKKKKMAGEIK